MKEEVTILNQLKKASLPAVPDGFFTGFSDELWQLIELEDSTEGFLNKLDLNRFENVLKEAVEVDFKESSLRVVKGVETPGKGTKTKRILLWAGAVAASFALFLTWPSSTESEAELANTETTQEVLLAYLDEDDLVEYLVDANANQDEETSIEDEILYEELEDEIYNYINDI